MSGQWLALPQSCVHLSYAPLHWQNRFCVITVDLGNGKGNGNPVQYSRLGNPMGGGAWWVTPFQLILPILALLSWVPLCRHLGPWSNVRVKEHPHCQMLIHPDVHPHTHTRAHTDVHVGKHTDVQLRQPSRRTDITDRWHVMCAHAQVQLCVGPVYRHTSFYCTSLYCALQILHFLPAESL